ncbi:MAG: DrmE family protein [Candidatus Thiodiazotropha sp.]
MDRLLGGYFTHKDRNLILDSLSKISLEPEETDDSLIRRVSLYLRENLPSTRAEVSYHQFGMDLVNYLRLNSDNNNSEIVRRTLKYLLQPVGDHPVFGNPTIKAFVASITLHKISGEHSQYFADENRGLSPDEKQAAEEILLSLADSNSGGDTELLGYIRNFTVSLGDDVATSVVNRFQRNIRKLIKVISTGKKFTDEQKAWARGGLRYIRLNEDAISDDFGMIGLLDDMYIAAVAVRFIDPVIQSIEEVILDLYNVWPFLRDLILKYKDSEYTYSEFAIINTALVCPALTVHESVSRSALILPSTGVTPFVIAFGAALGAAYDAAGSGGDATPFALGQKVKVDNDAVAIYDGVEEIGGEKFIRLMQYSTSRRQKLETAFLVREEQASRLCPAPDDAIPKGKIPTTIDDAEISISGTEALFHLPVPQQFNSVFGRVWLISQASGIHALASEIHLYGYPLSGVIPMGHIKRDGALSRWDSRFGTTECLLTTVSDLDLAAEILEEQDLTDEDLIVIDLVGSNRSKFASLSQIQSMKARVLCVAEEKDIDTISNLEDNSYDFWEWSAEEVGELFDDNISDTDSAHPFLRNDAVVVRSLLLEPDIRLLSSSHAEKAKADLDQFVSYVRKAGDDVPTELREYLDNLLDVVFQLIRLPVPLSMMPSGFGERIVHKLELLSEKARRSVYLDEKEKALVSMAIESLQYFAVDLEDGNPKSDVIRGMVRSDADVRILAPPRFSAGVPLLQDASRDSDLFIPWQKVRDDGYDSLIIPYWPGRGKAWDILSTPPCCEICFILYSFEDEWRSAFYKKRNRSRDQRARYNSRSAIFTQKHIWTPPVTEYSPVIEEGAREEDTLIDERDFRFRQRLVDTARKEGEGADTEALMIVFRGGVHAFFTPGHEVWSAKHLLFDPSGDIDTEDKLLAVKVKDIVEDDVLVFIRGTDRDAIRHLADANLPPGTREKAKLWRKSLTTYVDENDLSVLELQKKLADAGCKRHTATLKQWLQREALIGPRYYARGDLEAIAEVTRDNEFRDRMGECANAINRVWGEHMRASQMIAERVLSSIEGRIKESLDLDAPLDIGDGLVLAQVEHIGAEYKKVPVTAVNQLREDT